MKFSSTKYTRKRLATVGQSLTIIMILNLVLIWTVFRVRSNLVVGQGSHLGSCKLSGSSAQQMNGHIFVIRTILLHQIVGSACPTVQLLSVWS